jgi:hypothetical protein
MRILTDDAPIWAKSYVRALQALAVPYESCFTLRLSDTSLL